MLYSSSGLAFAVSDIRYFSSTPQVLITEMCPRTEKKNFFSQKINYNFLNWKYVLSTRSPIVYIIESRSPSRYKLQVLQLASALIEHFL